MCLKTLAQSSPGICVILADFTLEGGNPVVYIHSKMRLALQKSRTAPVMSSDGQVLLYQPLATAEPDPGVTVLQPATHIPTIPRWATLVGQAYHVSTSPGVNLDDTFISFAYLGGEVPPGEEPWLSVYHFSPDEDAWHPLTTTVAVANNTASARLKGSGLYALLSSSRIELKGASWNVFGYPVPGTRAAITETLQSVTDRYSVVYEYDPDRPADPWRVYAPGLPTGISDLTQMTYGRGYFIHITDQNTVTLRFRGVSPFGEEAQAATGAAYDAASALAPPGALLSSVPMMPKPPMLVYGRIQPGAGVAPTPGMPVMAWIAGQACGTGQTFAGLQQGEVWYQVKVKAADEEHSKCGTPDRVITFTLDALTLAPTVAWSNTVAQEVALTTPAAAQSSTACSELLRNGDFEQSDGWVLGETATPGHIVQADVHGGSAALLLGLRPSDPDLGSARTSLSTAYQFVPLPRDAATLKLQFWYKPGTEDHARDYQRVLLLDSHLDPLREMMRGLTSQDTWQLREFDVTAYRGRTVVLYFEVNNNSLRLPGRTWLAVDNVSLVACK